MDHLLNYNRYNREEIVQPLSLYQIEHISQYLNVINPVAYNGGLELFILEHVKSRIHRWLTSPHEDTIWIERSATGIRSPLPQQTLEAIYAKKLCDHAGIVNVSYFYSLRRLVLHDQPGPSKREMLLDMVRSIISQLAYSFLPSVIYTDIDLSIERFQRVANPGVDINTAISLMRDVRSFAPPYINCIIEGLEKIEDPYDLRHTNDIVTTLHHLAYHASELVSNVLPGERLTAKTVRACFTSDGNVAALVYMVTHGSAARVPYLE
ncbi:hypothetical protein F5Y00DRAFT_267185 [Daldinia vernicosa]|uniref:uncharacterized protein n=1 Tax=Daldinia vernicosa TaxID=114800 RepID=UPI0020089DBF|nr:uncharacterized protein F5Y00DRAFT_267185 [Daldinia vernicosa]KAI0843819.1 hypothetical protein F5Y00DRAFT_267185 [Daldinia vernicosa]